MELNIVDVHAWGGWLIVSGGVGALAAWGVIMTLMALSVRIRLSKVERCLATVPVYSPPPPQEPQVPKSVILGPHPGGISRKLVDAMREVCETVQRRSDLYDKVEEIKRDDTALASDIRHLDQARSDTYHELDTALEKYKKAKSQKNCSMKPVDQKSPSDTERGKIFTPCWRCGRYVELKKRCAEDPKTRAAYGVCCDAAYALLTDGTISPLDLKMD